MHTLFSRPGTWVPLLVLLALASVPFVAQAISQPFYVAFFARIIIYAIAACALNIALGFSGLVSFGHSLFLGLGAYAVGLASFHGVGNGWVHLALCLGVCACVGLVTGAISLRTSGIAFIMITLAFAQMGYFLFVSLKNYGGDDGLAITLTSRFGPVDLSSATSVYITAFVVLVLSIWCLARLRVAPFGMVIRGAKQNTRRVSAAGIPVVRYQLLAYVMSGMLCGVAGLLLANLNAFASPSTLAWTVSGELIVIVVIGGLGTVFGPLMGALVFLGLEEVLKGFTEHWMVIFGPLIVIVALLGKRGIVGLLQDWDGSATNAKGTL
ncbi:branched-chain amino acid ABC transporter permease [Rhodoferax saidenbachensis]|uniref:Branched-chain amino acid transport system permease protein n=1 Tax=Rhodoferax saidenbachensis TaxID=1484693 RepID=A0ABU1ZL31_9BURK|nr:branched-chain amino acid ABC transporter permease [Rhodoferax saidenbachensis]MDR7306255.1 branched-chain amino acid transport system permease protein [Rhodoferax saidenbachensis]